MDSAVRGGAQAGGAGASVAAGTAELSKKAELYKSPGLRLVYHPEDRRVTFEAHLSMSKDRVGGASRTLRTPLLIRAHLALGP